MSVIISGFRTEELLPYEHDAQRTGTAMAGNRAAGSSLVDMRKSAVTGNSILYGGISLIVHNGMGDEEGFAVQIFTAFQTVCSLLQSGSEAAM